MSIVTYQNSSQTVNFCISVGVARYNPCPRLLKQKVLEILYAATQIKMVEGYEERQSKSNPLLVEKSIIIRINK